MRKSILLFALAFSSSVFARADDDFVPIITAATVNAAQTQITIMGNDFGNKLPVVTLGTTPLKVVTSSNTSITAILPSGLTPGAYLIDVENKETHLLSFFEAAIGQTGPTGPAGPAGLQGIQGPVGPAGLPGLTGPVGPAGAQGLTGPVGPAGAQGITGPVGPAGAQGLTGPVGPAGAQGITGPVGPAGAQGAVGLAGIQGPVGPSGPNGVPGAVGPAGPTGPIGPKGPDGATGPVGPAGLAGGQVWSANMMLDSDVHFIEIGSVSGASPAAQLSPKQLATYALQVPQACSASNFQVTVLGTTGTSTALVAIGFTPTSLLTAGDVGTRGISCTVTGSSTGDPVKCSSSATTAVTTDLYLTLGFFTTSSLNPADFNGAHVMATFTCQ